MVKRTQKAGNGNQRREKTFTCPRCGVDMKKKERLGVTIDKCPRCDGLWLDGGEIDKIILRMEEFGKRVAGKNTKK